MKQILPSILFCTLFSVNLFAQNNLLRELIDLPAPPPISQTEDKDGEKRQRSEEFYDKKNVPSDDAPIEDLLDFWKRQNFITIFHPNKIQPSEKTLARLINSAKEKPENLPNILTLLPINPETSDIVKDIYDRQNPTIAESERESIKKWLKYKSSYFSDELLGEVQNAKDHKTYKTIGKEEELRALAQVDWEKAESLLEKLKDDKANPRTAFFAKRLIYEHAINEKDSVRIDKYRNEFKEIVENKSASGVERNDALEAMIHTDDEQNQDDWFLSLFADETLLELNLGERTTTNPLDSIVSKNRDKWIPVMTKLVGNNNPAIHNAAVQALIQFQNQSARKDALLPLLPWLTNPDWAKDTGMSRHRLIQSLDFIDIPEGVLGLIWIVENDETYADWAADSLAKYKDARAIPAIKAALAKSKDEEERKRFLNGLLASGGLNDDEQLAAIEIYAEKISTPEGFKFIEETYYFNEENIPPLQISIGKYLANSKEPSEGLILRLIERQKVLQKEKPAVAKILSEIMSRWQSRLVDLALLGRIERNEADLETIVGALARRKELKERIFNELYALRGKSGLAGAIAACLIENENDIVSAFRSENVETQIGTLACARLLRKSLPVAEVGVSLDSQNKLLALAAERYLESEDSLEARQMVWAKHPGEALILGARESFNPAKTSNFPDSLSQIFASVNKTYSSSLRSDQSNYAKIDKFQNALRDEVKSDENLLDIYAIYPSYIVRVYKTRVVLTYLEDKSRFYEGVLKKEEFDNLKDFFVRSKFEETPPIFGGCHHNCGEFEYVRVNKNSGRRFYSYTDFMTFIGVSSLFQNLRESDSMKLRYYLQDKVKGLKVLLTDKKFSPQTIWKNGDDFRILVSNEERKDQIEADINQLEEIDQNNEDLDYDQRALNARKRRAERAYEHFEWREFKNGKLGESASEPAEIPFLRYAAMFPALENLDAGETLFQSKYENHDIRAGIYNTGGLWKVNRYEQTELKKGVYNKPLVSGNWVVAAKAERDWSAPNSVVRVNLKNGKEFKINLPPAEEFYPIAIVPSHNKVLLYRAKEMYSTLNPTPAEYYLLDPNTGKTEFVKGEFQPFMTQIFRPLQSNGEPNEFWATVYSRAKNETEIGIYNTKNFSFKPILKLPEILLNSMGIWVDVKDSKVYFIYEGDYGSESHLLSVPIDLGLRR